MAEQIVAADTLTKRVGFDKAPAYPNGLLAVQEGVKADFALAAASILLTYVRERSRDQVQAGVEGDEPWVHALLVDMALALYSAAGVES